MAFTDDLKAYWKLDETSGTRNDSHGSNHLTANGSPGSASGKLSNAVDLERSSTQYLSRADNADLSGGSASFTISAWVQLESKPGSGLMTIVSKHDGATVNNEYILYWDQASDRFKFSAYLNSGTLGTVTANVFGAPGLAPNWYFVTAWRDATNNQIGIAVNAGTPNTVSYSSGVADTSEDFRIGATGGGGTNLWDGLIDEVGFWKRVLTSNERRGLYNGGIALAYPFNPQLQSYFIAGGSKSTATMDNNVTALQIYADGGWEDTREKLQLLGDFYYFNDTVIWPTRTGLPNVAGSGGEPIYHAEELYTDATNHPGGLITAMVWGDPTETFKPMWTMSGHGGIIDGVAFIGKMTQHQADLLVDGNSDDYPYEDPWATHPDEDRCWTGLQIDSAQDFGSGKHFFPHGLSCMLFQRAIWVTDTTYNGLGDQWHIPGRTAFYYCDIGVQVDQIQCVFLSFEHIDASLCSYPLVYNKGDKLLVHMESIEPGCKAGLYLRGSDSQGDTVYYATGGDFTASTGVYRLGSNTDFSRIRVGDHAYGGDGDEQDWYRLVTAIDADNFEVTVSNISPTTTYYGSLANLTGTAVIRILANGGIGGGVFVREFVSFDDSAESDALSLRVEPEGATLVHAPHYSATRTYDKAGHLSFPRANAHKGTPFLNISGNFDAPSATLTCSGSPDLSSIQVGDWLYGRADNETSWRWISLVTAKDNTAKTITVSAINRIFDDASPTTRAGGILYGQLNDLKSNNATVQVYSKDAEKPIYRVINSYGVHTIENHDNLFDGMIHVEGGISTHFPTFKIRNCSFRSGTHIPELPTAIFTRGSTDKVQVIFEGNHEDNGAAGALAANVLTGAALNLGKAYEDARFVGSLSDGVFTPAP